MSDEKTPGGSEVREGRRIARVMARAGLCSRREAEAWIAEGRVSVNGRILDSPAFNVSEADDVRVDGNPLAAPERTRLFLFHKPRGLVTTARDPEGRPTIFAALPPALPRVVAIGRLDINSEGLLLLTNDGGLARVLELPATGWLRRYRVRAHGSIDQATLDRLGDGVAVDGVDYLGIEARLDREQGSNAWITMGLREGKNREIKKVLEYLGLAVNRLIRISFGPFELGDLAEGDVAEVRTRVLRDQLGVKLAKEAGANFDAPLIERATPPAEPGRDERRHSKGGAREGRERERIHQERRSRAEDRPGRRPALDDAPRRARPAPSFSERRRKHVSALRAEIAADASGPRKRVERGETRDRKGRAIAVERLRPTDEAHGRAGAEKRDRADGAGRGKRSSASAKRRGRNVAASQEAGERTKRVDRFEKRRSRDGEGREPRSEVRPRGPRERRFERGADERRGKRPEGAPARSGRHSSAGARAFAQGGRDAGRPAGERRDKRGPPRSDGASRPPGRPPNGHPPAGRPQKGPGRGPRRPPRKP
jgi:23S rRNA pseudouridine2605 synthase